VSVMKGCRPQTSKVDAGAWEMVKGAGGLREFTDAAPRLT
jgi:hypothetical protein